MNFPKPRYRCSICKMPVFIQAGVGRKAVAHYQPDGSALCHGSGLRAEPRGNRLAPISGELHCPV